MSRQKKHVTSTCLPVLGADKYVMIICITYICYMNINIYVYDVDCIVDTLCIYRIRFFQQFWILSSWSVEVDQPVARDRWRLCYRAGKVTSCWLGHWRFRFSTLSAKDGRIRAEQFLRNWMVQFLGWKTPRLETPNWIQWGDSNLEIVAATPKASTSPQLKDVAISRGECRSVTSAVEEQVVLTSWWSVSFQDTTQPKASKVVAGK